MRSLFTLPFRNPRSYTGEHVVEISCHGSPYVQERVIQSLLNQGARLTLSGPANSPKRAFINGKIDLTQAEAVADLIASNTAASARTALYTIRGGFSRALRELREQLINFSALQSANWNWTFPQEECRVCRSLLTISFDSGGGRSDGRVVAIF